MILALKFDLDIVKMYHHTKNEVFYVNHFKRYSPNWHTNTQTLWKPYLQRLHMQEVKSSPASFLVFLTT